MSFCLLASLSHGFQPWADRLIPWLGTSLARHPLACAAMAALAGILVVEWGCSFGLWLVAVVMLAWTLASPVRWRALVATGLVFGCVHDVCLQETREHPLRQILKPGQEVTAIVRGRFLRVALGDDEGAGRQKTLLRATEILLPTRGIRITGVTGLRIWMSDRASVPTGGLYELNGSLSLVQRPWNPGLFDPVKTALRQGLVGEIAPMRCKLVGEPQFSLRLELLRYASACRHWIAQQLALGIEDQEMPRTLVTTMALGTAESDVAGMEEPFRNSGTLHVFAVSGLHVGLLAAIGWTFLRCTGLGQARATVVLIPVLFGYAFMTGWVPSAARAAFMATIMLAAPLLNRQLRLLNSLGTAALILLVSDTQQLFQVGFQLSFGVLAAIALGARWLSQPLEPLTELDPFVPPSLAHWHQNLSVWLRRQTVSLLTTSTAAWAGSMPLMIHHFHTCTPISVIANGLLVPLSFASLLTVALSLVAAICQMTWVQECLNNANWLLAHLMMSSATLFSSIPGSHFPLSTASLRPAPVASLSVLSMPPGEGAQVLMSGGQTWLLDCGGVQHYRRNLLPFLRLHDVAKLDGIVLSHADANHAGAAVKPFQTWGNPSVLVPPHEPWPLDSRATAMWKIHTSQMEQGRAIEKLQAGDRRDFGRVTAQVLYPTAKDLHDKADDRALIIRLDCVGFSILWCNDAGFIAEKALLERLPAEALHCDVLLRNQHATDWSALTEFLLAVNPKAIVTSNSPTIDSERVPEHVVDYCTRHEVHLFDQSLCGMVRLEIQPHEMQLRAWLTDESLCISR
jgi:ComEC/Rec2-related protein